MTRLIARAAALAVAAFVVLGPLASLAVWSLAERWTAPSPWPQRFGLKYWNRMLTADLLEPLRLGVLIALIVTAAALLLPNPPRHPPAPPGLPPPPPRLPGLLVAPALP